MRLPIDQPNSNTNEGAAILSTRQKDRYLIVSNAGLPGRSRYRWRRLRGSSHHLPVPEDCPGRKRAWSV